MSRRRRMATSRSSTWRRERWSHGFRYRGRRAASPSARAAIRRTSPTNGTGSPSSSEWRRRATASRESRRAGEIGTMTDHRPTLVFIIGPPAVGKMTVGHELARRTGLKLFHNHQTIDLVLPFFPFGSPPFGRLVGQIRRRILEEVASSDLPGIIFTFVWAFDQPSDDAVVEEYSEIFRSRGGRVVYVELETTQEERLRRNETEFRLAAKPFKRDLATSRRQLLELDDKYQLNSRGRLVGRPDYLLIENSKLSAEDVAERIIETLEVPRVT